MPPKTHGIPCGISILCRTPRRACDPPATDACAARCTTQRHCDQNTQPRRICYPWHPLYDIIVFVIRESRTHAGLVARCRRQSEDRRRGFDIPLWMLDPGTCAVMQRQDSPRVSWQALLALRRLLDDLIRTSVVENRQHLSQGDADESTTPGCTADLAAESVRPTSSSTELGDDSAAGTTGGPPAPDPATAEPSTSSSERSRKSRSAKRRSGQKGGGR